MIYQDLENKVALVTGGSFGIGRATVLAFAKNKAKVAIADINVEGAQAVAEEVIALGGEAIVIKADVSKNDDVKAMVAAVVEHYGRLDVAFNNAGIDLDHANLADAEEEMFDTLMNVNVKGVWLCMKYEVQQMLKQGGGAIVNTASMGGVIASPKMGIYGATKHAVVGLTKTAAVEYGRKGIRVNSVCPGVINTEMTERAFALEPKAEKATLRAHPIGRFGESEDIANGVMYLSSEASSFVLGHQLMIEGGFTAI
ncbi:SDR family oxidoreductase [Oceaniserpentilla sp. 4NH20-0058]|uniref:SDR family oxidoreductase n=1 Tax=Oceaniserpentilla sp. 4NH20-0058 TaxID=3127660 RepID=UPI0031065115